MLRASFLKGTGIMAIFAGVACADTSEAMMWAVSGIGLVVTAFGYLYASILEERADYARRKKARADYGC